MTKEELKQEAEEYAEGMAKYYASTHEDCIPSQFEKYLRNAYISSAEPRERRIEELEKACEETQELLDKQIEATYRLDKENAELKKDKKELCHSISEGGKACVYLNEQLTKAKEIIKIFLKYEICTLNIKDELADNIAKAKAFLKSEGEK